MTFRAYPDEPIEGTVTLVYHEMKPETRTGRVRIEIPNPDLRFKTDMYADVIFRTGADGECRCWRVPTAPFSTTACAR